MHESVEHLGFAVAGSERVGVCMYVCMYGGIFKSSGVKRYEELVAQKIQITHIPVQQASSSWAHEAAAHEGSSAMAE